jgi:hypothetical protein
MNFDPSNRSLKIWDSIRTLTPKVRVHLGVCGFIPLHSRDCECDSHVAFPAWTFPCPCLGHEAKVTVMIVRYICYFTSKSHLVHNGEF